MSNFKISELKILINFWLKYFSFKSLHNSLSFSIKVSDFGLLNIISLVNAPVPGPISTICLFLISLKLIIFLIIFLSTKNFDLKIF